MQNISVQVGPAASFQPVVVVRPSLSQDLKHTAFLEAFSMCLPHCRSRLRQMVGLSKSLDAFAEFVNTKSRMLGLGGAHAVLCLGHASVQGVG
eukprot:6444038-Amphidinium_carterae.1